MNKIILTFLVVLSIPMLNAQTISKGPYLIYPFVNSEMTVLWQLSDSGNCEIRWGTDSAYSLGVATVNEYSSTTHQFKYTITGLTPGDLYYYQVGFGSTKLPGSFRAAPENSAKKTSFYAWGDTRDDQIDPNKITASINSEIAANPEYQTLILHSGDWVANDAETNWANEFFNRTSAEQNLIMHSTLPQMGCRGNHEANAVYFKQYFPYNYQPGGCYYSYDYGPLHISVVDQYVSYSKGSVQYNWLDNDLKNTTKKWKIILLHEPGWSANGAHPNNVNVQTFIQPLCTQYHVSMVMAGHNHYYARGVVSNIVHLTIGGGGAVSYTPQSGQPNIVAYTAGLSYMRFDINNDTLNAYAMNNTGTVIDSYTIINGATSVSDKVQESIDVRIIPNPSAGLFDFYCSRDLRGSNFEIYNINGQLIKNMHNSTDIEKTIIDLTGENEGIYYLRTYIKGVPITSKLLLILK